MRVRDQLVYLGRSAVGRDDVSHSVDTWLGTLGLADRAEDRLDTLSHGNQQRVQLIAALVNDPDLLVLDEPFSGLDPLAISNMSELLAEVAAAGATVLFSSHQLDLVEDLCEDVVIVDHGRVVLAGDLDELRAAVRNGSSTSGSAGTAPDWSRWPRSQRRRERDDRVRLARRSASPMWGSRPGMHARARRGRLGRLPAADALGTVRSVGSGVNGLRPELARRGTRVARAQPRRGRSASRCSRCSSWPRVIVLPSLVEHRRARRKTSASRALRRPSLRATSKRRRAVGTTRACTVRDVGAGEQAVRDGRVDVLVVDGRAARVATSEG